MHGHLMVLQEESERVCGAALPTEIVLAILFRWGGLVSPTALAVKTAPELREFREWLVSAHPRDLGRGASEQYPCLCYVPASVGVPKSVVHSLDHRLTEGRLNVWPQVEVVPRTRREAWHIIPRACPWKGVAPNSSNWFTYGECGRVVLLAGFFANAELGVADCDMLDPGTVRNRALTIQRYSSRHAPPERGIVWTLLNPSDEWWRPYCAEEGRTWWEKLIEVLQGQPMTTHMETRAHAWELYKRADRGEVV
jgi:hypothetical protein